MVNDDQIYLTKEFSVAPYNNFLMSILLVKSNDEATIERVNLLFPEVEYEESFFALVHRYYDGTKKLVVIFNTAHTSQITADVFAHEAVHVKNMLLETIGQENLVGEREDEHEAYLVGYLTHIFFDAFIRAEEFSKINFSYNEQHY